MFTIVSDIDAATQDVVNFFGDQVPFALSGAINDTAFDVRKEIVEVTFGKAFEVRNPWFARQMFRVTEKATKRDLTSGVSQAQGLLFRDYLERHATGGTKVAQRNNIAVPINPEKVRTSRGAVQAAKKPRRLKNSFIRTVNGKKILFERKKKEVEAVYVLQHTAPIKKSFDFYEDALATATRVFSGHFDVRMDRAIRSSRFFPA